MILILSFFLFSYLIFEILYNNASGNFIFYKIIFHFCIAIWGSILVLIFYINDKRDINKSLLKLNLFLGKISYSIYLFHLLIIYILSTISFSLPIKIIIYLILQLIISTLLYYFFEEPILKSRPDFK